MAEKTFRLMLAVKAKPEQVRLPAYVSPKIDGVRGIVKNSTLLSRQLKPFPNRHAQKMLGRPELDGLDFELVCGDPLGPRACSKTTSALTTISGEPELSLHVFDTFSVAGGYRTRYRHAKRRVRELANDFNIHLIEQRLVHSALELDLVEQEYVALGYEGLVARHPEGPYKCNRSTISEGYLLKITRFESASFQVLGFNELLRNANEATTNALGLTERSSHKENMVPSGMLGSLRVIDVENGWEFDLGTGFEETERIEIMRNQGVYMGAYGTYRFTRRGMKDKPRFPSFQGWRDIIDMETPVFQAAG